MLDPTGRRLVASVDNSDVARVISIPEFSEIGPAPEHCDAIGALPDQFAARKERAWQITGRLHGREPLPMGNDWEAGYDPKFSPDGSRFAWGTFEGPVMMADLEEVAHRLQSLGARQRE